MLKSRIYTIINITAKSLTIVMYIIPRKIFKIETFLIIKNCIYIVATILIYIILIIKLDNIRFWLCYLLN